MADTKIARVAPEGMVSLKADLADARQVLSVPEPLSLKRDGDRTILWMAPDELLVLCPRGGATSLPADIGAALGDRHHLAADVSDARVRFRVEGDWARDTLAKLTPADLSPEAFGEGRVRRTRIAQVPAAIWLDAEAFHLLVFRSVAAYAEELLWNAARHPAGYFTPEQARGQSH